MIANIYADKCRRYVRVWFGPVSYFDATLMCIGRNGLEKWNELKCHAHTSWWLCFFALILWQAVYNSANKQNFASKYAQFMFISFKFSRIFQNIFKIYSQYFHLWFIVFFLVFSCFLQLYPFSQKDVKSHKPYRAVPSSKFPSNRIDKKVLFIISTKAQTVCSVIIAVVFGYSRLFSIVSVIFSFFNWMIIHDCLLLFFLALSCILQSHSYFSILSIISTNAQTKWCVLTVAQPGPIFLAIAHIHKYKLAAQIVMLSHGLRVGIMQIAQWSFLSRNTSWTNQK